MNHNGQVNASVSQCIVFEGCYLHEFAWTQTLRLNPTSASKRETESAVD